MSDPTPRRLSRHIEESLHVVALSPGRTATPRELAWSLSTVGHGLTRGLELPGEVRAWLRALDPEATSASLRSAWEGEPPRDEDGAPLDGEAVRRALLRAFAPDRLTESVRATLTLLRPAGVEAEPVESGASSAGGAALVAGAALTDHVMASFVTREVGAEDVESLAACRPAVAEEVLASVEAIAALGEPLSDEARVWAATRTLAHAPAATPTPVAAPRGAARPRIAPWLAIAASVALAFGAGAVVKKQTSDEAIRSEAARAAEIERTRQESARAADARKQSSLTAAMREQSSGTSAVGDGGAGAGEGSGPFDRGAAARALSGVSVDACKAAGGPTGEGHVAITFEPDGSVRSVVVDAAPYAGTTVGGCIAGRYRAVTVPPFQGAPVQVGKRFSIP